MRDALPGDLGDLLRIEAGFATDRLSRRSLRRFLGDPRSLVLVVETAGRAAGYALVLLRRGVDWARLYSIAVAPNYGGRGLGAGLLAAAERRAAAVGRRRMRLEVREDNAPAIALYRKAGYCETGRIAAYYEDGETALRMEKALAAGLAAERGSDRTTRPLSDAAA